MLPLDSAKLKTRRAKRHLKSLEISINRFLESNPYIISNDDSGKHGEYFINRIKPLPESWSLIVGDFAHNLRSCLDHIAHEFNIRAVKRIREDLCQFPICDEIPKRGLTNFPECSAKTVVNDLQPYNRRQNPKLEMLSTLRDLDNADKHRTITPIRDKRMFVSLNPSSSTDFITETFSFMFDFESGGNTIMLPPSRNEQNSIEIHAQISVDIIFHVTERKTRRVYSIGVPRLHEIYIFVKDEIVPQFETFF